MTVIVGESRMSSVSGLNARPRMAMVLPFTSPNASTILSIMRCFTRSLTRSTASMIWKS
ncbi:hypothetical protein D3C83_191060 [compost metagenome]